MTTPKKQKKQPQRKKDLTPTKGRLVRGRKLFGDDDDDATPQKAAPAPAPKKTIQQQIKDAFYNPKTGLWNASKIYKKLKAQGVKVKLKDVKAVLDQQLVTQVYKPVPKKKKDRYITIIANPASNTKPICSTSSRTPSLTKTLGTCSTSSTSTPATPTPCLSRRRRGGS